MATIAQIAQGHWQLLLPKLGVDAKFLVNRHGPCPICGGTNRFRWDNQNGKGGFICNQCGAGDGFSLAVQVTGRSFAMLAKEVETIMGVNTEKPLQVHDEQEAKNKKAMFQVWGSSRAITDECPVGLYLKRRTGIVWKSKNLRWHPSFNVMGRPYHAMIARVTDQEGTGVNLHVTILTDRGVKAPVETPKRVMPGKLPVGSAIRLTELTDQAETIGVAEGIETAISASIIAKIPVWSCINKNILAKWEPPVSIKRVVIFADNDENYSGHSAAYALANRLSVKNKLSVDVALPPDLGDWNDHHMMELARLDS